MPMPKFRIPDRFEAMVRMANGAEIQSIITEVKPGLGMIDELYDEMESAGRGAFLILSGKTGSGKSTLLHTVHLFRDGVATFGIESDESIPAALVALPPFSGKLRIVVLKGREALANTSMEKLEEALHAINQFIRSEEGEHTLVAWPCNKDDLVDKLVTPARQIGGTSLLGVGNDAHTFHGPPREQYLAIAKKTIETLNAGASLASLGITEQRAQQLAGESDTIGMFLVLLGQEARRNRDALTSRLPDKDWYRMWVVVTAGNDPEGDVAALTRGVNFSADIDRLLSSTQGNVVKGLKAQPDKLGLLGAMFDAKIVYLPYTTAMAVIRDFADEELRRRLKDAHFPVSKRNEGERRLRESELAQALTDQPVGLKKPGRRPGKGQDDFEKLTQFANGDDGPLNRTIGQALLDAGLVKSFRIESKLGSGQVRNSDLLCQSDAGPVRLEFMWRAKASRAEIANYVLTKLTNYGRAIGFLNGG